MDLQSLGPADPVLFPNLCPYLPPAGFGDRCHDRATVQGHQGLVGFGQSVQGPGQGRHRVELGGDEGGPAEGDGARSRRGNQGQVLLGPLQ